MSESLSRMFVLRTEANFNAISALLCNNWQAFSDAGKPLAVIVQEHKAKRSIDQNAKFHAICQDISDSRMEWAGKRRTPMEWKLLLVSGHAKATEFPVEFVPGLEGEFVNLRELTRDMGIKRMSSLIEYCLAFCSENQIEIKDGTWGN
jgi:hypothetical protein